MEGGGGGGDGGGERGHPAIDMFPARLSLQPQTRNLCRAGVRHAAMLLAIRRGETVRSNPGHWDKCQQRLPGNWKLLQPGRERE